MTASARRIVAALMGTFALAAAAQDNAMSRARVDYMLHCSGCHGMDGTGKPGKGIPGFVGQVGHFQRLPEGRAFLMQVPGLLSAGLSDERAAAVTTWMLREFAGASLPGDFAPYTATEARAYRLSRPADVIGRRNEIYRQLLEKGFVIQ